jgi:hypothetical protein
VGSAFTTHLLITQAAALLNYKRCAQQDDREGAPGCTILMLSKQIENVLTIIPGSVPGEALREWRRRVSNISDEGDLKLGFSSEDWGHIQIVEREQPQNYGKHITADTTLRNLTSSQWHPLIFFRLVFLRSTRRSWYTLVLC